MAMTNCVICEIVAGTIPSWIIYQDAEVICFLRCESPTRQRGVGFAIGAASAYPPDPKIRPRFDDHGLDAWPKSPALQYDKDELLERILLRA
jgi:hypothetical protein